MKRIEIKISENKLEGFLSIIDAGDNYPSFNELIAHIHDQGIVHGLDEGLLHEVVKEKKTVHNLLFAKGDPPIKEGDVQLEWKINIHSNRPVITESDRADFKRLKLFEPVQENQVLIAKKISGSFVPGHNILGRQIPIDHEDMNFPMGENTKISADGMSLHAAISGYAVWEDGKLNVFNMYRVNGDVNYATGNIKFNGPVVIEGDVRSGFRVEATGSIYIAGNVEAASVYSQSGDITIKCGILGKNKAKLLAGGSLICGYIQDATVSVRKDVIVEHYIINSVISAAGMVSVDKMEGLVRGGSIVAEKGIRANEVGSGKNTFTELKIRNTTENEGQSRLWEISRNRTELTVRLAALRKKMSFLNLLNTRIDNLSLEKQNELQFVEREIKRLAEKIKELDQTELAIQKESSKEVMEKQIYVHGALYGNVSIDIGGIGFFTDTLMQGVKIYRLKQEIIVETLAEMNSTDYDLFVQQKEKMF